ncbi:MAG: dephospho-CoA kinase [Bacteroides sp.]|nr:dephospho-CoA kinase [Bacteroides sp.]
METSLIGICGGIGSGKSVVSRILRQKGYPVYDCDSRARFLMEHDTWIKEAIRDNISENVTDGIAAPYRRLLGEIVFSDENLRKELNRIVHGRVREDLTEAVKVWHRKGYGTVFVEAAVLAESGLAELCQRIWIVRAGESERIGRIMKRDRLSKSQIEARFESQRVEEMLLREYEDKLIEITNSEDESLLCRIEVLLAESRQESEA